MAATTSLELEKLIVEFQEKPISASNSDETPARTIKGFFQKTGLSRAPYRLRYSLDRTRPDLFLIHPTNQSDVNEKLVQECNGIILDSTTFTIVAHGMNSLQEGHVLLKPTEADADDEDKRSETLLSVEESEDGTVLRLFHHGDEWMVATNRRIDAREARWSSRKSFYEMFCEALPTFDPQTLLKETLDPNYTYSVILLHPDNQLVAYHPAPRLIIVSRRHIKTHIEESSATFPCPWAAPPTKVHDLTSVKDIQERYLLPASSLVLLAGPVTKRGVIISDWSSPTHVRRWKIDSPQFVAASRLRRNFPTFQLSYLASHGGERDAMKVAFPMHRPMFEFIDNLLMSFANICFTIYQNAFIRRQYTVGMGHPVYQVLRRLHRKYKTTGHRITFPIVWDTLYELPVKDLDSLLQYHINHYPPQPPPQKPPRNQCLSHR